MGFNRWVFMLFWMLCSTLYGGHLSHASEQNADVEIASLYLSLTTSEEALMSKRLDAMSQAFLGKPYVLGALGEGPAGRYDQYPLYRTDGFDCLTFVETVLALTLAKDVETFSQRIKQIRYQQGQVSFLTRNHFTDLDWNKNIQKLGILRDVTRLLHDQHQNPVAKMAHAQIDKAGWYDRFKLEKIRVPSLNEDQRRRRLMSLKQLGNRLLPQQASIAYIPLSALFDASGKPNHYLFQQIPNGAVIEIIRPNWDLKNVIGTNLNVSHLGFAFWHKGRLIFRNASSIKGHVVDQSLIEYLQEALKSPTIKGINIQVMTFK